MADLRLTRSKSGIILSVKVSPGASRERIVGPHDGSLKLSVLAPPERGKANRAVLKLLATVLDLSASELELLSGAGSSLKRVLIRSLSVAQIQERLRRKESKK